MNYDDLILTNTTSWSTHDYTRVPLIIKNQWALSMLNYKQPIDTLQGMLEVIFSLKCYGIIND